MTGTVVRVYGRADEPALERARARLAALREPPARVSLVSDGRSSAVEAAFAAGVTLDPENESAVRGALVEALYPPPVNPAIVALEAKIDDLRSSLEGRLDGLVDTVAALLPNPPTPAAKPPP